MKQNFSLVYEDTLELLQHSVAGQWYNGLKEMRILGTPPSDENRNCHHKLHVSFERYGYASATYHICIFCPYGYAEVYPARVPKIKEIGR